MIGSCCAASKRTYKYLPSVSTLTTVESLADRAWATFHGSVMVVVTGQAAAPWLASSGGGDWTAGTSSESTSFASPTASQKTYQIKVPLVNYKYSRWLL